MTAWRPRPTWKTSGEGFSPIWILVTGSKTHPDVLRNDINVIVFWAWSCQEKLERSVRIVIFDFLSPLNTLQPLLLGQKLRAIQPDNAKVSWIIDYLRDRPQFAPSRGTILDLQKGTVASPSLFTLYLSLNYRSRHLQIFSDDSSIMVCIHKREGEAYCMSLVRRSRCLVPRRTIWNRTFAKWNKAYAEDFWWLTI